MSFEIISTAMLCQQVFLNFTPLKCKYIGQFLCVLRNVVFCFCVFFYQILKLYNTKGTVNSALETC